MKEYEAVSASCLLVIVVFDPDGNAMLNVLSVGNIGMSHSTRPGNLMLDLVMGLNNIIAGG